MRVGSPPALFIRLRKCSLSEQAFERTPAQAFAPTPAQAFAPTAKPTAEQAFERTPAQASADLRKLHYEWSGFVDLPVR